MNTLTENTLLENARSIGTTLGKYVNEEEQNRRPSKTVLAALREAGFLNLFMPESIGGLETDPLTTSILVEEIAGHNAAAAWSMMVTNTSTWWCNRLSDKGVEEVFAKGPDTCIAGAFHPPMRATPVEGGYLISGRSPLASNVHEANWIFVTAFVMDQGQIKMYNGIPEIVGVFMDANDCEILDTWYTIGMQATDSNDVVANEVYVPVHLSYPLVPEFSPNKHFSGSLYKIPAIGASVASLIAPISIAIAQKAIDELKLIAENKVPLGSMVSIREKGTIQKKLGLAEANVQSSRAYLHQAITHFWNKTLNGENLTMGERGDLLLACTHTNQTCVQAVDLMYSAAGSTAIYTKNNLSRCFLNAQVIRQHGFANEGRYETAGQIHFGLHPDLPVVLF